MATWPSGSKASTTNLDSGTDRPSLARADLKQNVDNVNDVIDMFNISGPTNNQILKYNSTNTRFELASLTDANTTYTISAITDGADANIRLTGSDASIDEIQLIAGSNITLSVTSAGAISIAAAGSTGMTSFTVAGDSGSSQTINDGNTLTISGGTGLTAVASATDTITLNLDNTAVTPNTYAIATITVDQQGRITSASAASTTGSGNVVLASSPSLTTPTLGVASATTINKVTITAPATGSTLTIADGKTLTASNTLTFTGTDTSSVAFGTGGTVAYTGGKLSQFAATTSSELAGVISDETGSGSLVFATSPSLTTPTLGVASATSINKVAITAPASSATLTIADGKTVTVNNTITLAGTDSTTLTLPGITSKLGFLNLPAVGTKTGSYTLATGDVGKYVQVGSGGSITIPDATFAEGDVVLVANNHSAAITITCTITTAYIAGTDTDKASVSLATRGVASIVFLSSTVCIISGNVT